MSAPNTSLASRLDRETQKEKVLVNDPKYRRYQSAVDKSLATFEQVQDWPDFITFLARLLKTLQPFPQYPYIPHKLLVAKRLAQCLNAALPTGVHQRALDVYVHILTTIGTDGLTRDLGIWSLGLFPFFQYAATSVRPVVLGIYTKFFLPLQEALRPCTKAFVLALLPGVDEETSEFFDNVSSILDQLCGTVSPPFFFKQIWLILITAPSSRTAVFNYITKRLPTLAAGDRIAPIIGDNVGLLIRGLAASLEDSVIYVQRAVLDLLVATFPTNSLAFQSEITTQDRILLMRSALSIVLKRDLSLSRRLYSWLLGSSDNTDIQSEYLHDYSIDVITKTLQTDLGRAVVDSADGHTKPFKIILALMDKWEIGFQLTEHLSRDILLATQRIHASEKASGESISTSKMLFEAMDPFLVWKDLYIGVQEDLKSQNDRHIRLAEFVARSMPLQDHEIAHFHLPLFTFGVISTVRRKISASVDTPNIVSALELCHLCLQKLSPQQTVHNVDQTLSQEPISADKIYLHTGSTHPEQSTIDMTFHRRQALNTLTKASAELASRHAAEALAIAVECMPLVTARSLEAEEIQDVETWLASAPTCLQELPFNFTTFRILTATVRLCVHLQNAVPFDTAALISVLVDTAMHFLEPSFTTVHVEACDLFWLLQSVSETDLVQAAVCRNMQSSSPTIREKAFTAFGHLWMLTEDAHNPSRSLAIPLFIVLDAGKSSDLQLKHLSNGWIRCYFKNYLRLIDTVLYGLIDPSVRRENETLIVMQREIAVRRYVDIFDQYKILYHLNHLHDLFLSRGATFHRIAKSSLVRTNADPEMVQRLTLYGAEDLTYLDAICVVLVEFLSSFPTSELDSSMASSNAQIHSSLLDILQIVVQRADLEPAILRLIQYTLTASLATAVDRNTLELQNKLLHTLHATLQARQTVEKKQIAQVRASSEKRSMQSDVNATLSTQAIDETLSQVILFGFARSQDCAALHFWVDFLFMSLAHLEDCYNTIIYPLMDIIIQRLTQILDQFRLAYNASESGSKRYATEIADDNLVALIGALERLVLHGFGDPNLELVTALKHGEKSAEGTSGGGFLTYVTGAFASSDPTEDTVKLSRIDSPFIHRFHRAIWILILTAASLHSDDSKASSKDVSRDHVIMKVSSRGFKSLERVYKQHSAEVLTVFMSRSTEAFAMRLLDRLAFNAQTVVKACVDRVLAGKPTQLPLKSSTFALATDTETLNFLEEYVNRLDGSASVQIWPVMVNFAREATGPQPVSKGLMLPIFRCFTTLSNKVASTSALEDRRMRKELQDNLAKLSENAVAATMRLTDKTATNELSPRLAQDGGDTHNVDANSDLSKSTVLRHTNLIDENLLPFLRSSFIANLKLYLFEADKIAAICTTLIQQCIAPSLNSRIKPLEGSVPMYEVLQEICKVPSATKVWKPVLGDWFHDNRFFNISTACAKSWRTIVQTYISSDKERIPDLLGRISTNSSANIFANRELEALNRCLSIRRLSYTLLTADKNKFLLYLPAIQEKLVDILRLQLGDVVHSEVFLALRILVCRFSEQHLSSLWPIVLTEIVRLIDSYLDLQTPPTPDQVQVVVAVCKFLDLMSTLQTEDFQLHEWTFAIDKADPTLATDGALHLANLQRLAATMEESGVANGVPDESQPRGPLLTSVRQNHKYHDLQMLAPFLTSAGHKTYERIYAMGGIDYEAIVDDLFGDLFDGDD